MTELLGLLGFDDLDKKGLIWSEESKGCFGSELDASIDLVDGSSDFLVWDTPVVSLDDLIVSDSSHNFQAMGVPPLPKVYSFTCLLLLLLKKIKDKKYFNEFFSAVFMFI